LLQQCEEQDVAFDHAVLASGSAGTHAGFAVGLRASGSDLPILGVGVNLPRDQQEAKVWELAQETAVYIDRPECVARNDIIADCDYIGPGYGEPTESMNEAVLMLARLEGLLFDPVYSGKALAGMIDYIRKGRFEKGQKIVFLHTGGVAGLFAYADILTLE
jgi:L-cysteate sulfo-lyase